MYFKQVWRWFFGRVPWEDSKSPPSQRFWGFIYKQHFRTYIKRSHRKAQVQFPSVDYLTVVIKADFKSINQSFWFFPFLHPLQSCTSRDLQRWDASGVAPSVQTCAASPATQRGPERPSYTAMMQLLLILLFLGEQVSDGCFKQYSETQWRDHAITLIWKLNIQLNLQCKKTPISTNYQPKGHSGHQNSQAQAWELTCKTAREHNGSILAIQNCNTVNTAKKKWNLIIHACMRESMVTADVQKYRIGSVRF